MRSLKALFHFLGGFYLAMLLIAMAAIAVILGTFFEARSESHLYAAQRIYSHPLFAALLALFFINILFSTLRRWPFKLKHIPFLITHLGLLMVIAGCMIKNWYGVQGNLMVVEGSGNQMLLLPHTYALQIEEKHPHDPLKRMIWQQPIPLKAHSTHLHPSQLKLRVVGHTPHVSEKIQSWIKKDKAYIAGTLPFAVQDWSQGDPLHITKQARLNAQDPWLWDLIALHTNDLQHAIETVYLHNLTIQIKEQAVLKFQANLKAVLEGSSSLEKGHVHLSLPYSPINGFEDPQLQLAYQPAIDHLMENMHVSLQGNQALYVISDAPAWITNARFKIDLIRPKPLLLLIEDGQGDSYLFAFDVHGRVHAEPFGASQLHTLIMYDQGFGGYTTQASIPFASFEAAREIKERADRHFLTLELQKTLESNLTLSPPLQFLKNACQTAKADFVTALLDFLSLWDQSGQLLLPAQTKLPSTLSPIIEAMNWNQLSFTQIQGCQGVCLLLERLQEPLKRGENIYDFLQKNKWPFVKELPNIPTADKDFMAQLTQKMFAIASHLPPLPLKTPLTLGQGAHLFSAYLKAHDIDYSTLFIMPEKGPEDFNRLYAYHAAVEKTPFTYALTQLETPLTPTHQVENSPIKLENLCPQIFVEAQKGEAKQLISLAYDPLATGLKWPFLQGEYLARFQPQEMEIPYRVRLRQARQLNYAQSNQPYSYECDILICAKGQEPIEKTLSMNHVHETWDGYRFYLAGMVASDSGLKRIQLVVNYDPVKYYLTYPGGLITALGILLLFWLWPYKKA
jgi:hypothetical protein